MLLSPDDVICSVQLKTGLFEIIHVYLELEHWKRITSLEVTAHQPADYQNFDHPHGNRTEIVFLEQFGYDTLIL